MTKARECGDKVQYASEFEAQKAIAHGRRTRGLFRVRPYRCRYCNQWHIGHQPAPARRKSS